jgi:hypothetical protein
MTDTTKPNGDRDRPPDREAALDRNDRPHSSGITWGRPKA